MAASRSRLPALRAIMGKLDSLRPPDMKTILVPTEQHELTASLLQTALLLARKLDAYMEGFALFPAMVEILRWIPKSPCPSR